MPSSYIQSGEYATYGLPSGTTANQVTQASVYIDAYLRRPEGLIWTADASGNPCYMAGQNPTLTLNLGASLSPGQNVQVAVTGAIQALSAGDVLICDRSNNSLVEPLVVVGGAPAGFLIFQSVTKSHSSGATLDQGLAITEQRYLAKNRPIVVVSRTPIVRLVGGIGRYGYPRRGDAHAGNTDDFNLLAVYGQFGGPPAWEVWNPAATEFDPGSGQLWIPAGIMLAYYTEVRFRYLAGFAQAALPTEVKMACARVIGLLANDPNLGPVKSYAAGGTRVELFADTLIPGDIKDMLKPYAARVFR